MANHVRTGAVAVLLAAVVSSSWAVAAPKNDGAIAPLVAPATRPGDEVVARVGDKTIYLSQLEGPLIEAYGLNVLFNVVKLELAKEKADALHLTISEADVQAERDALARQMAPDAEKKDYPNLLKQLVDQQKLSQGELEMLVRTRAYLRKIALQDPIWKKGITDAQVREAFNALYGETVRCRHIQCKNLQDIHEAQRRLAAGETFAQVAKELSENKETAPLGGELMPFSRSTPDLPQAFKDAVFALKVGEISDPVEAFGAYHLVKLEQRIAPKAVKFEDVKDEVRARLEDGVMQQLQKQYTSQLTQQAVYLMKIENPVLKKQLDEKLKAAQGPQPTRDREQIREDLEKSRPPAPGATPTTLP